MNLVKPLDITTMSREFRSQYCHCPEGGTCSASRQCPLCWTWQGNGKSACSTPADERGVKRRGSSLCHVGLIWILSFLK